MIEKNTELIGATIEDVVLYTDGDANENEYCSSILLIKTNRGFLRYERWHDTTGELKIERFKEQHE